MVEGDNMREGLNKDVGFESGERIEKMRGMGEVGKLFVDRGEMIL
ncbi:adenylyl-sulfate kinase, partial [Bacillus subtilis]